MGGRAKRLGRKERERCGATHGRVEQGGGKTKKKKAAVCRFQTSVVSMATARYSECNELRKRSAGEEMCVTATWNRRGLKQGGYEGGGGERVGHFNETMAVGVKSCGGRGYK